MMKVGIVLLWLSAGILLSECELFPFKDVSLPWNDRVDDLVGRLSLTELMLQLAMGGAGPKGGPAPAIPRLGIGKYSWNTECLRGDAIAGEATSFPQSLGLAAAFSPKLIHAVSKATGQEVRAKYNDFVKRGMYGDHKGLSCFSPVINIMRHPQWGRNQETYGEDPYMNGVYATNFVQGLQGTESRYIMANAGCKHFDAYAGPENIPTSRLSFDAKETYGEDPYLSGEYATQYVKGLQGDHFRYVQANAGCKHFDVHGGPENIPVSRFTFDSKVSMRDWRLTFLPAFRACVKANSFSLMCSYNSVNGIPACAHHELLTKILREEWDFEGYVVSDEAALEIAIAYHKYFNNTLDAAVAIVKAGCNLELSGNNPAVYMRIVLMVYPHVHTTNCSLKYCERSGILRAMCINGIPACSHHQLLNEILREEWGFEGYVVSDQGALEIAIDYHRYFNNTLDAVVGIIKAGCNLELSGRTAVYFRIVDAVKQGKLSEALVRERARPLFLTRMRLGEFDPVEMNPYNYYNLSLVQSPEHRSLAIKAAMQSFVLLKNQNNLLPLAKHFDKIAVVGPMADNLNQLFGDYAPDIDTKFTKTPRQGLESMATTVNYAAGCKDVRCKNYTSGDIKKAVQGTQLVVVCVGTGQELESEGNDRADMNLAGSQSQLIEDALTASPGIPVILLVFSAGPVNISFADRDNRVTAIIQCFFPAQATGEALFNVITMATEDASPAGRLPYTWFDTLDQVPSMTDYSMEGHTYRYFKKTPLYPFGYGLSYSKFEYLDVTYIPEIRAGDNQYIYGTVMNIGDVDAYEVVQVYLTWENASEPMPQRTLVGFDRYFIQKDNSAQFKFLIKAEQMAIWTDAGWVVEAGKITMHVGGQQPDQKRSVGSNVLTKQFVITGSANLGKF